MKKLNATATERSEGASVRNMTLMQAARELAKHIDIDNWYMTKREEAVTLACALGTATGKLHSIQEDGVHKGRWWIYQCESQPAGAVQ